MIYFNSLIKLTYSTDLIDLICLTHYLALSVVGQLRSVSRVTQRQPDQPWDSRCTDSRLLLTTNYMGPLIWGTKVTIPGMVLNMLGAWV